MSHMEAKRPAGVHEATLDRHNVLRSPPADGSADTLYHRDDVLLLPVADLTRVGELNVALAAALPGAALESDVTVDAADCPGFMPRFARLRVLPPGDADGILRLLRKVPDGELATVASRLTLEHVAFPSVAIFGEPGSKGHGAPDREPVAVLPPPPVRRTLAALRCGRRPVVAILDTGVVLPHQWFPPADPASGGDAFVVEPEDWMACPVSRLPEPESPPIFDLLPLPTHAGHGTFIAGLIRQLAPDARVLSMRVMHADDGAVYENLLLDALEYLCGRVESGDPERFVDVVSLSLGYREQAAEDRQYTDKLRALLHRLGRRGVQVVASAGNRGDEKETYPAAIAAEAAAEYRRVHSVGALNPNGTRARYSCHGEWVTDWQVGTRVISSFPRYDGDALPEQPRPADPDDTENLDPDDFTGGYASWSGTSFAAAVLAGRLARALIPDPAQAGADGGLLDVRPAAANDRADRAYAAAGISSIGPVSADERPAAAPSATGNAERGQRLAGCLQRARDGDRAALDEVVLELNPLLWHVARAQGLAKEDASDVVQTTWLELVRRLREIRHAGSADRMAGQHHGGKPGACGTGCAGSSRAWTRRCSRRYRTPGRSWASGWTSTSATASWCDISAGCRSTAGPC